MPGLPLNDRHGELTLPYFSDRVRSLDQVVEVDYYVPGCPPQPKIVTRAVLTLLGEHPPTKGSVLAPDEALCTECPRKDSKPDKIALKAFRRPQEIQIDETQCLLAQVCSVWDRRRARVARRGALKGTCLVLAAVARLGECGAGAKALSAIASLIDSQDESEIDQILATIPDPAGTFYRYSLPASLIHNKRGFRPDSGVLFEVLLCQMEPCQSRKSLASPPGRRTIRILDGASLSTRLRAWKATEKSKCFWTTPAKWIGPTSRYLSCEASRSLCRDDQWRRCRRSPRVFVRVSYGPSHGRHESTRRRVSRYSS